MAARRPPEPLLAVLGAVGGLVGVAAARCGGGCASCLACAVPLVGLVTAAVVTGRRRREAPGPRPEARLRSPGAG